MATHKLIARKRPMRLGYRLVAMIAYTIFKTLFGLKIKGTENVPKTGAFIMASNHKSWFDPPIVGCSCPREINYAAKKELFSMPILVKLVKYLNAIPVKRRGFDREALVRLGERLESGEGIIIFPEGTRFLDDKLHPPKPGIGFLALKYQVPIIPVYVKNSARIRRQLFKRNLSIEFGKPFNLSDINIDYEIDKESYNKVANAVMRKIAELGKVEPPEEL